MKHGFVEWQRAASRQRAEHDRTDHAARLRRRLVHVETDEARRTTFGRVENPLAAGGPVPRRRFFGDRIDAMGRSDQQGPITGNETAQDGTACLHQFGGDDDIDIARHRHERQDRIGCIGGERRPADHFDVIDGRPGTLRDPRHRCPLRDPAVATGKVDHPVGEDAAALSAQREDRHRDAVPAGLGQIFPDHQKALAASARCWRCCSHPITAPRSR